MFLQKRHTDERTFTEFGTWSECSTTCGGGFSTRSEPTNETTAKNIVVVGMVTLVVSFSGVVFAREREEDTKKTKKTTTNGRRNYLKTQSAFANARGF